MGRRYLSGLVLLLLVLVGFLWLWKRDSFLQAQNYGQEAEPVKIILDDKRIVTSGESSVEVKDNTAVIRDGGTFLLTGKLTDGQIIVAADKDDEVILKFNGVDITCRDSAPVWIRRADKVTIKLRGGSDNVLTDGLFYVSSSQYKLLPRACLDSRASLKIKGAGSLKINANYQDGIVSTDKLKIKEGVVDVEAARHGLRGKDCVEISGGLVTVRAGGDGIRTMDFVKISLAAVNVDAGRYGIFGLKKVQVDLNSKVEVSRALSPVSSSGSISLAYPLTDQGKE